MGSVKIKASIALGLAAVALAGCGGSSGGKQQVESAFHTLTQQLAAHNPAACNGFTERYALANTGQSNYQSALAICRRHISGGTVSVPNGLRILKTKVSGNSATIKAAAPGQGTGIFHFLNVSGHWKIDSVTAK